MNYRRIIPNSIGCIKCIASTFGVIYFDTFEGNFSKRAYIYNIGCYCRFYGWKSRSLFRSRRREFGKELDSLCDLGSFGVAPAILIYQYGMTDLGLLGKLIASILHNLVLCV